MPKIRIKVTETVRHVVNIEVDQEIIDQLTEADECVRNELAGDFTSGLTVSDGYYELESFEVVSR